MDNMEQIIEKIVEIEKKADEIVSGANAAMDNIDEYIENESESLRCKIMQDAEKTVQDDISAEKTELSDELLQIEDDYNKKLQFINDSYKKNKREWINKIYKNVIG